MEFTSYIPDVNEYKKNLSEFYLYSEKLQSNRILAECKFNILSKMKVSYQPFVNAKIVPYFDFYVNEDGYNNIGQEYNLGNLAIPKEAFPSAVRNFWVGLKITLMQDVEEKDKTLLSNFSREGYLSFDKWITEKLNEIQIPQKSGNMKDIGEITQRNWIKLSNDYAEIHQMRKIEPGTALQMRLEMCQSACHMEKIDCAIYVICSLGLMEDCSEDVKSKIINAGAKKFNKALLNVLLDDLGYRFVDKPTAGNVIVYLRGSENEPVHFGKFVNHERVVSKIGSCAIYEHHITQCCYGDSYVILSKSEKY